MHSYAAQERIRARMRHSICVTALAAWEQCAHACTHADACRPHARMQAIQELAPCLRREMQVLQVLKHEAIQMRMLYRCVSKRLERCWQGLHAFVTRARAARRRQQLLFQVLSRLSRSRALPLCTSSYCYTLSYICVLILLGSLLQATATDVSL
jgi:hypothetical protein